MYQKNIVKKLILTGGKGKGQQLADSELARNYVRSNAVPAEDVLIETKSKYTIENLSEAKLIMDSLKLSFALIVSDPLHMKRAISLAAHLDIDCKPSPTKTSMYKSFPSKSKSLLYETFFYSLGQIVGKN